MHRLHDAQADRVSRLTKRNKVANCKFIGIRPKIEQEVSVLT